MQFQSKCVPMIAEPKALPQVLPALHMEWEQPADNESRLHYHDCLEIGLCLKGSGVEMIGRQVFPFRAGSISVIQRGCIHDSHIPLQNSHGGASTWRFLFVDEAALGIRWPDFGGYLTDEEEMTQLFQMMYQEIEAKPEGWGDVFSALLSVFAKKAERHAPDTSPAHANLPQEMAYVLKFINAHYDQPLTAERLARACSLSLSSFDRMFLKSFGMPPMAFVRQMRLTIARHLLQTTRLPVLEIASRSGFQTLSSFNRQFKQRYGISPREMRAVSNAK